MKIETYKTDYTPKIDDSNTYSWQCVFIPTMSIIRLLNEEWLDYFVINVEWLFWSFNVKIDLK